ncbi:MAG TPA: hypothetical protein PLZ31_02585 [Myxococcota bacterium]|nr:hypothetical protein [Myxococcota bacterium]
MKVDVEVFQDHSDGSFAVRTKISDADGTQVGEFFLPGGTNLSEAEALARSIIDLAESGYDLRKLMPDC